MSELKAGVIRTPHNEGIAFDRDSSRISVTEDETEFYLKSEVDEVIRHQKYKRCLAMAEWCDTEIGIADTDGDYEDMQWYQKWYKRWIELADQFKEAK